MGRGSLIEVVEGFLLEDDWSFEKKAEDIIACGVNTDNSSYRMYIRAHEDRRVLLVYVVLPSKIPAHQRESIAEYIARANYGLWIGNLEFDMNDGEVRYKTSIDVDGGELTARMVSSLFSYAIHTMDKYFPGFMAVCYGGKSPAEAINDIDGRTSPLN
jgi:hypothetical protein